MATHIKQWVGEKPKGKKPGNDPYDVQTVQKLLKAASGKLGNTGLDPKTSDGRITPETITAIQALQKDVMKADKPDGRIDPNGKTWKTLLKSAGEVDTNPEGWPALPDFDALGPAKRAVLFGTFDYESAPAATDADAIKIKGTWVRDNIETVTIPQLANIENPAKSTRQSFHKKASKQFVDLWQAWDDGGLLDRVLTYAGSFVPRFQRKTARIANVSPLSNHSWGTAFDINVAWNGLNATPAIIWEEGCVFELVDLAHQHGFFWGGHFSKRVDGMHFEVAKIV
jgi:hypothetical protein